MLLGLAVREDALPAHVLAVAGALGWRSELRAGLRVRVRVGARVRVRVAGRTWVVKFGQRVVLKRVGSARAVAASCSVEIGAGSRLGTGMTGAPLTPGARSSPWPCAKTHPPPG
eukprot:scaffold8722_cov48-Phaeocystis_antarctica.AAC.4